MPPKKKRARKSSPKKAEEPLEYVARIREKSGKQFLASTGRKKNVNLDIEQNIREIQALLKINAEIFDRCMSSTNIRNRRIGHNVTFTRYGYGVVHVRRNRYSGKTEFTTKCERSDAAFDMNLLAELPDGLNDVFTVKYQAEPFGIFIDYDSFFEKAIILHDEVLEPFLAKLKCHVESIHVCLGKIESWLLENNSNLEFLEATFRSKLQVPTDADCNNVHVLQSCSESGTHERTFDISKKSEQTKLKKFLDFVAS